MDRIMRGTWVVESFEHVAAHGSFGGTRKASLRVSIGTCAESVPLSRILASGMLWNRRSYSLWLAEKPPGSCVSPFALEFSGTRMGDALLVRVFQQDGEAPALSE